MEISIEHYMVMFPSVYPTNRSCKNIIELLIYIYICFTYIMYVSKPS